MRVKWNFVLILALVSNNQSVFSPQGPTEGCGVIPVKRRRMCTDPDPGGILLNVRSAIRTIPLILWRRAYCDLHSGFAPSWKHASKYSQAGFCTVLLLRVFFMLFGSFSFCCFLFLGAFL